MKLILLTHHRAQRVAVHTRYDYQPLFFAAPEPPVDTLITVTLAGLTADKVDSRAILRWLGERAGEQSSVFSGRRRRERDELDRALWRPTILEDFIDADNAKDMVWNLSRQLPLREHREFLDSWLPRARAWLRTAELTAPGRERVTALTSALELLERVMPIAGLNPHRVTHERDEERRRLDRLELDAAVGAGFVPARWIEVARGLETESVARDLLVRLAREFAERIADAEEREEEEDDDDDGTPSSTTVRARLDAALRRIAADERLKRLVGLSGSFWLYLTPHLPLPANTRGETVDISQAVEVTVSLNWPVLEARRIGAVVPGRAALFIQARGAGERATFIRGQRKLKFKVKAAGGALRRLGNTLTLGGHENSMHEALVEVDRLDTLANIDPQQAARAADHLELPADHPLYAAAAAAGRDPRYSRVLADLLIELLVGVDADIARALARAQARQNRR